MDERQRLLAVLDKKPLCLPRQNLPWFADLSYLYSSMIDRGTLEKRFQGEEGYLAFHQEMGAGVCFYAPFLWKEQFSRGITKTSWEKDGIREETIETPLGTVREVQRYMRESFTWVITEHFVKGIQDLRVMLYASQHRDIEENYEEYRRTDTLWGPSGYAVGPAPIAAAPLQKMFARWAGVSATMEIYMDDQEELEEIFSALEEADDAIFDVLCNSPCKIIEFAENLSAEITGRKFFEEYNAPYYRRRIDALHRSGKKVGIHNDGTLRGTFDLLGKCGFDFIEAITPSPVGDIPLEKLREEAGSGIVLWGGLPGVLFSPLFSEEQFESCLQNAVKVFKADGLCVLGVADQVPPDGLISRIKRVREVVDHSN